MFDVLSLLHLSARTTHTKVPYESQSLQPLDYGVVNRAQTSKT